MSLFVRKPMAALMNEASETGTHTLKRTLGAKGLIALGIGAIIGAGLFSITGMAAANHAGPAITISFVVVMFYALTILGIFVLRKNKPELERPYKAFGYPLLPAIYILMAIAFCVLLIIYKPTFTWPGLIIVLIGIPIYYIAVSRQKTAKE